MRWGNMERRCRRSAAARVPHGDAYCGRAPRRQVGVAKKLFAVMGIARDDKVARQDWVLRGFRQFDAPVCVLITYDRELAGSDDTAFDCGAVATALVNTAWSRGLGTVINSQGDHAIPGRPRTRAHRGRSGDPESIALGWPDHDFPANAVVSERPAVQDVAVFVGFEG